MVCLQGLSISEFIYTSKQLVDFKKGTGLCCSFQIKELSDLGFLKCIPQHFSPLKFSMKKRPHDQVHWRSFAYSSLLLGGSLYG